MLCCDMLVYMVDALYCVGVVCVCFGFALSIMCVCVVFMCFVDCD